MNRSRRVMLFGMSMLFCGVVLAAGSPQRADELVLDTGDGGFLTRYGAMWEVGPGEARVASEENLADFLAQNHTFEEQGFRLVDFETWGSADDRLFVGLWHEASKLRMGSGAELVVDASLAGISSLVSRRAGRGLQMVDLEVYPLVGGELAFSAIFHPGESAHPFRVDLSAPALYVENEDLESNGYRLIDVETYYDSDGERRNAALWTPAGKGAAETDLVLGGAWQGIVDLSSSLGDRHLVDFEYVSVPMATGLGWSAVWAAPAREQSAAFPVLWNELVDRSKGAVLGSRSVKRSGLLVDVEILLRTPSGTEIESSLGGDHDGPLIPGGQPPPRGP